MTFDGKAFGEQIVLTVREFMARSTDALSGRIDAVESTWKRFNETHEQELARKMAEAIARIPPTQPVEVDYALIERGIAEGIAKAVAAIPPARPGKDADPDLMRALIAAEVGLAVSALPKPQDGKSVDPADVIRAAKEAAEALPKPADGKSITVEDVAPLIAEQVRAAVAAIPKPQAGKDADPVDYERIHATMRGETERLVADGIKAAVAALPPAEEVDTDMLLAAIKQETLEAIERLPVPQIDPAAVKAVVEDAVRVAVAALPAPKAGKDADPEVIAAMVERAVDAIPRPKDGEHGKSITVDDVRGVLEAECARFQLEFERRAADVLQRAIDRIPAPKDGKDGFGLEQLAAELDPDGRTVRFRFVGGETVNEQSIKFNVMIYRGIWAQGRYVRGDTVTFAGSLWHANKDTDEKPGNGSADWTLCAKRGADAK